MRPIASTYTRLGSRQGTQVRLKGRPSAKVAHFVAPVKGLSYFAELNETDPLLASILVNWTVEEDCIRVRPGYIKMGEIAGNPPISTIIPYHGDLERLAFASGSKLYNSSGAEIASGFGGDDWAWTAHTDLGDTDYTVMVNGFAGVVSWDGITFTTETVTAPTGETWINPLKFDKVISHMNRLWFADSENLAVYYLPLQQKSGEVAMIPFNALFKRGGKIRAIFTWTMDGGRGMDDQIAIFTSNGEVAIYSGVDPATDFRLVGVFRFDAPMSKNSILNYGGELYILTSTGLVPMAMLLQTESDSLGKVDKNVMKEFTRVSKSRRGDFGWSVILNHQTNHVICNMPTGAGNYQQMVRFMPGAIWSKWTEVPARCWCWLGNTMYFASDDGKMYRGGSEYLSDDGAAINADVRFAWSGFGSVTQKQFKMLRLYAVTDGVPRPYMDMEVDYAAKPPINQPELTQGAGDRTLWDVSPWGSPWSLDPVPRQSWQGVTGLGRVGAPRIRVSVLGCTYTITGIDVLFEPGSLL